MSQTDNKPPKLTIKQKRPGEPLTGANAVLELDGKPLRAVTYCKIELKAGKLGKVLIEFVPEIEFEAEIGELEMRPRQLTPSVTVGPEATSYPDRSAF